MTISQRQQLEMLVSQRDTVIRFWADHIAKREFVYAGSMAYSALELTDQIDCLMDTINAGDKETIWS